MLLGALLHDYFKSFFVNVLVLITDCKSIVMRSERENSYYHVAIEFKITNTDKK